MTDTTHARDCFTPKAFYLSLCMPLPPTVYTPADDADTLIFFGAVDPDDTITLEAA